MLKLCLTTCTVLLVCLMLNGCGDGGSTSDPSQLPEGVTPIPPDGPTSIGETGRTDTPPSNN